MSKEKYTKITLSELVAKAEQRLADKKKPKTAEVYVKSLDGTITLRAATAELMSDITKMEGGEGDAYLVYQCCAEPNLKSSELQEAYGCVVPTDIVHILFEPGEIASLSVECAKLAGYFGDNVSIVDGVKN